MEKDSELEVDRLNYISEDFALVIADLERCIEKHYGTSYTVENEGPHYNLRRSS